MLKHELTDQHLHRFETLHKIRNGGKQTIQEQ